MHDIEQPDLFGLTDAEKEDYLLAQNKLWVITGEVSSFSDQIAALVQQMSSVQAQLGTPTQITAPQTGYFIRSSSSGRLNAGMEDILALGAVDLKAYIESSPEIALDGCAGKIVSGFTWYYAGIWERTADRFAPVLRSASPVRPKRPSRPPSKR